MNNFREIGATLSRNKTRTLLTAFGIFWGTAMLALLWGGAQGFKQLMARNFEGFASNSAVIFPRTTTMAYKGFQKGMNWQLTLTDVDNIRANVPGLEALSPSTIISSTIRNDDHTFAGSIMGIEPAFCKVLRPEILGGRFINDADLSGSSKVCVIGTNVAAALFGEADPMGQFVECDNVYYRIVGIARQKAEVQLGARIDDSIIVPLSYVRRAYNKGLDIDFMMLVAQPGVSPASLRPGIFRSLRASHPLHPDDSEAIFFMDVSEQFEKIDALFIGIEVLILFVGFSSLIAGIIGVGNIMWIVVKERTKEFGIRRAIGAKPRTIMWQIMTESAVLTSIAGTAGICFAVLVLGIASKLVSAAQGTDISFQLSFSSAIIILILFLTLGGAAGSIPALKAMRIKPIEALNDK